MAVKNPTTQKKTPLNSSGLLRSSEILWKELFEEFKNLQTLHKQVHSAKGSQRQDLEVALYASLSHINVHSQAMLETADED